MLDFHTPSKIVDYRSQIADILPDQADPDTTSEKYSFINTKTVVDNMLDLGYGIYDFRRPNTRTAGGIYGLHEVDFRLPEHMKSPDAEAPRILFYNTYNGTRRAQFLAGVFRFACSNGLVLGETSHEEKFLHMNLTEDDFLAKLDDTVKAAQSGADVLNDFKTITLDPSQYHDMAEKALELRFPEGSPKLDIRPDVLLSPRRAEDLKTDLWTSWNVIQENLMKGGVPGVNDKGDVRISRPVNEIQKASKLNRDLWDLLKVTAEA